MVTMTLGGLWHGASWTFVAWGGLHGVALAVNHIWEGWGVRLPRVVGWALTGAFSLVGSSATGCASSCMDSTGGTMHPLQVCCVRRSGT